MSRRQLLGGAAVSSIAAIAGCRSGLAGPADPGAAIAVTGSGGPRTVVPAASGRVPVSTKLAYGPNPAQFGHLRVPPAAARRPGAIVVIHGGFWSSDYSLDLGTAIAQDLSRRGWVTWNLEYRRLGNGGGWPATFQDVAAGIDALATVPGMSPELDLSRVLAIGHSSGGHLAAWAASRSGQPADAPGARPAVRLRGVVAQAGVLDLRAAQTAGLGGTAVGELMGGSADEVGRRYDLGSPIERVPTGVPVRCVHSPDDGIVPMSQSADYVAAARLVGDEATLVPVTGDHFALIHADSSAWRTTLGLLPGLLH